MRPIKFRAWDGKKMWFVYKLEFAKGNSEFVEHYGTDVGYLIRGIDNKGNKFTGVMPDGDTALLQFTGLHDKHGKEIYEGDIVKDSQIETPQVVYFREGSFMLGARGEDTQYDKANRLFGDYVEVIGNRFEHPHLLGENDDSK